MAGLFVQLPGVRYITALTILAAIGDIGRFPNAKHLVGYAGLGARVYSSGMRHATGRLTKTGRKELRTAMIQVAHGAARVHPHWKAKLESFRERMKYQKAIAAIGRMMLVSVWHILSREEVDRHAIPERVARDYLAHVYDLGKGNRGEGVSCQEVLRERLDALGIGKELTAIQWAEGREVRF